MMIMELKMEVGFVELTGVSQRQWRAAAILAIISRDVVRYDGQMRWCGDLPWLWCCHNSRWAGSGGRDQCAQA